MTPREIALSICEPWFNGDPCEGCECHKVCTKLVERIETAIRAERVPEVTPQPVAYISGYNKGRCIIEVVDREWLLPVGMALYRSPPTSQESRQVEPVAVWELQETGWEIICDGDWVTDLPIGTKLYTAPPKHKPLTDEQITELFHGNSDQWWRVDHHEFCSIARAIERAHGIGGEE